VPLVHPCSKDGCELLTMGKFCIEHEHDPRFAWNRVSLGRVAAASALIAIGGAAATLRTLSH
jgi:hypothetical protein